MSNKTKWYNGIWIVAVGGGVISTLVADGVKKIPVLTTLKHIANSLFNSLISLLNFDIKFWWLLVAGLAIYILQRIYKFYNTPELTDEEILRKHLPDWVYYQADYFNGHYWSWDWNYNTLIRKFEIINLVPTCGSSCIYQKLEKNPRIAGNFYECPNCKKGYGQITTQESTEQFILDNISQNKFTITTDTLFPETEKNVKDIIEKTK